MTIKYDFGSRSIKNLTTCSPDLQRILWRAIKITPNDFTVLCGLRDEEAQNEAYATGRSTKQWPHSVHNTEPSEAVDVAPWRISPVTGRGYIPWKDQGCFYELAGVMKVAAILEGEEFRYGGDWDRDGLTQDQNFFDLGHFERMACWNSCYN